MGEPEDIEAKLAALERALDGFAPPLTLSAQNLDEISLDAPSPPPASAGAALADLDDALDPPIERLRGALGDL